MAGECELRLERAKKAGRKFLCPVPTQVGGPRMILKALPLLLTKPKDSFPQEPLGPFRTDIRVYDAPPESGLRITWFGHSGRLLEIDGARVLIDPVWDERASPGTWYGPKRFFAPTMSLAEMPHLDAVLISHDHYDHLGERTVRELARLMPEVQWITSLGVGRVLMKFGVTAGRITELDWTESVGVGPLKVTALPARHFSGRSLWNRNETLWSSFVLAGERHRVYYGADTGLWDGLGTIEAEYGPFDLTMLEVGAFNELWKDIHLGPDGAVAAFQELGGGLLMPIHWGLFDLGLHGWREPIQRALELVDERGLSVFAPEPGVPTEVRDVRSEWWR